MQHLEFAKAVLAEDLGRGDLFERVAVSKEAEAVIVAKSKGVLAGIPYATAIAKLQNLSISWHKNDGEDFEEKEIIATIKGDWIKLLQAERSLLNTLLHASSIATKAKEFVELSQGKIKVLDTRKTRPLLRVFEKYAARCGGVINHRLGLDDCLMLKDTHLALIDDWSAFVAKARKKIPFTSKIEIECSSFEDAKRAFAAGADIVMCDNMEPQEIEKVVALRNEWYPWILLEASGNITPERIRLFIDLGIDAISSGAIVHQAIWPDLSMKVLS